MIDLYSLRSPSTVTKFDPDGNPQGIYETSFDACTCPAGQRPTCRHRQMLTQLEPIRDTHYFLQWDPDTRVGLVVDFQGTPKRLHCVPNEPAPPKPFVRRI